MADYVIRATAAEGQIRAFAATTRDLTETARQAHNTSPVATAALGRLMTAAVMMGYDMKGADDLLTIKIQGDGPIGGLVVTADSHGEVKGYAFNPGVMLPPNDKGKLDVGGALGVGVLSVIKDIGLKEPYVGQTILVSGEIAEDLTYYYATSEQTPSSVALGRSETLWTLFSTSPVGLCPWVLTRTHLSLLPLCSAMFSHPHGPGTSPSLRAKWGSRLSFILSLSME